MKKTLFAFSLLAMSLSVFGQSDSIMLADYELNSQYPDRTFGWNNNLGLTIQVDNPKKLGIDTSDKVTSIHLTKQWDHAIGLNNFEKTVSLAVYPNIKLKVLSDSLVSTKLEITVTDINGFQQTSSTTLPADVNSKWADVSVNFADNVKNTPISFISQIEIMIDRGTAVEESNQHNIYYIDDIRFIGPQIDVTPSTVLTLFQESFSSNAWFMTDLGGGYYTAGDKTLGDLRTAQWGGSALSAPAKHYNATDSLKMVMIGWSGNGIAEFLPESSRASLSSLTMSDIAISGMANLKFSYDLRWKTAPAAFTDAPVIEYKVDNGNWTAVSSSSSLPSAVDSWANGLLFDLSSVNGKNISLRISNKTAGTCFADNLTLSGNMVFADSVKVFGLNNVSEINVDNGTLQMVDTIYPTNAAQGVVWSVENQTGKAEISSTGLLTAFTNGTVLVKARALDIWGTEIGEKQITLSNQIFFVDSISITGENGKTGIDVSGDTLDITIGVFPEAAHNKEVKVSIKPVGDELAAVYVDGKLIAVKDGQVYIFAEAIDGSGVIDSALFTITNQVPLNGIAFDKESDTINVAFGTIQLNVVYDPDSASNKAVNYSIISEGDAGDTATVSKDGVVKAIGNGTVLIRVVSAINEDLADTIQIVIKNQLVWREFEVANVIDDKNISGTSDFSVKGKSAWDNKYIYLKLDVTDDSIVSVGDNNYTVDNIEIYFDMTNGKLPCYPRGGTAWPTPYNGLPGYWQLRLVPGDEFSVNNEVFAGAIQKYQVTKTGYKYEVKFIIDSLLKGYVPEVGKKIGFDILASDNDNDPYYRDQLSLFAPTDRLWCDAAQWGTVVFTEGGNFDKIDDTENPSVVTNLSVSSANNVATLSWDAATDNIVVDKYIIFKGDVAVDTIFANETGNKYEFTDLTSGDYTVGVASIDMTGNTSEKVTKSFTYVGVQDASIRALKVYPNPSSSFISLNNGTMVNVEVFNAAGQLVILKSVNAGEKVNISALNNGIYTLRVIENNNVSVLKLIKK